MGQETGKQTHSCYIYVIIRERINLKKINVSDFILTDKEETKVVGRLDRVS